MGNDLQKTIEALARPLIGRFGVCVLDLATGTEVGILMDEALPMASTVKVPILIAAYREAEAGRFDLSKRIEFGEECRAMGSGLLSQFDPGLNLTYRDLLIMMICVSDNAATDLVLRGLTPELVTGTMQELGLPTIRVDRTIQGQIDAVHVALDPRFDGVGFGEIEGLLERHPDLKVAGRDLEKCREAVRVGLADGDSASPREMARLLGKLARHECAGEDSCNAMLDILSWQCLNTRLPRELPAFTKLLHKTGTFGSGAVVNDVGVFYRDDDPVATIAILSGEMSSPIRQTEAVMGKIGLAVFEALVLETSI